MCSRCFLFLRTVVPLSVAILYERGCLHFSTMTPLRSQAFLPRKRTKSPASKGWRVRFWDLFDDFGGTFVALVAPFCLILLLTAGRVVRSWWFIKIVAGAGCPLGNGVVRRASSALH